jgi:hypothetical protein
MDVERNKAVVARFDELGNRGGDLSILDELCTPDMVNHALAPGRPQGLEGTRELSWPGGSLMGFDAPAGTATRTSPSPIGWSMAG